MKKYQKFVWTMKNIEAEIRKAADGHDIEMLAEITSRWLLLIKNKKKRVVFWDICRDRYNYTQFLSVHNITEARYNQIYIDCLGMLLEMLPQIYKKQIGSFAEKIA